MKTEDKINLFRQIYKQTQAGDAWLDTVPKSINSAFFDNEYASALQMQNDLMRAAIFGADTASIEWFLYEWKPGMEVAHNGVTSTIDTIDDYVEWITTHENFGAE